MVVFYDLESHSYQASPVEPMSTLPGRVDRFAEAENDPDPVVCHCLNVRASQIERTIEETGARSLCELACSTGAGSGCTACHRRLRAYFAGRNPSRLDRAASLDGAGS